MISLVPMAGAGARFVQAGYRVPKPFIFVLGLPMFVTAIKSFPRADKIVFVVQDVFLRKYRFDQVAKSYFQNSEIVSTKGITEGQACTCLLAKDSIDKTEALLISSIDYVLAYDEYKLSIMTGDQTTDVIIFTFQAGSIPIKNPEAFAYCRVIEDRVVEVVEKCTISDDPAHDPAVVGTFYYRRSDDFFLGANAMIEKNNRIKGEFYVGTSINELIRKGRTVRIFPVNKFVSFGDPFELKLYQAWEELFYNEPHHPFNHR